MLDIHTPQPSRADRRYYASRDELRKRVGAEFHEMPCLRLTAAQARRLFGLRPDVCERILSELVARGWLACEDQCYRFNDARRWPLGHMSAHSSAP